MRSKKTSRNSYPVQKLAPIMRSTGISAYEILIETKRFLQGSFENNRDSSLGCTRFKGVNLPSNRPAYFSTNWRRKHKQSKFFVNKYVVLNIEHGTRYGATKIIRWKGVNKSIPYLASIILANSSACNCRSRLSLKETTVNLRWKLGGLSED